MPEATIIEIPETKKPAAARLRLALTKGADYMSAASAPSPRAFNRCFSGQIKDGIRPTVLLPPSSVMRFFKEAQIVRLCRCTFVETPSEAYTTSISQDVAIVQSLPTGALSPSHDANADTSRDSLRQLSTTFRFESGIVFVELAVEFNALDRNAVFPRPSTGQEL